ncbi:3-hydroxybutyryl-CoA dehydrogenase [Amycolatopsis sp. SID8362]|uniref:3-hydroxybutyryl-CoA dehydrogenase n=1 Tax=Amycolatopsis sp. SID8362 TaxID=2690346 RepID=UPI00136CF700|nr:3-hydroxybutyryl-CoA dehydrogenase [Amycolatopsis sp. SID8362]NBH01798.1 3-hydroxybutyryl-CoA dehydrogenase [Amycolatopsis sp. SID8362]NED38500.1 3-hydroxybutyryl-CoA dehydrogenase [Amycolatopsis sp. SID8362]
MGAHEITKVGVVGSGTMGAGIAELCATRGLDVRLAVSREASLTSAPARIAAALDRRVGKGKLTAAERDAALARITVGTDLAELGDRDLVVEAIPEDEQLKLGLFATLDKIAGDGTILASTTSAIAITRLAAATTRPERVLGLHFFNPVTALRLVEIVPALATAAAVTERVTAFAEHTLDRRPVTVADQSGFVVNALLIPYLLAAIRMVDTGYCPADQVDLAMELGCAHPMGPLRLADLIGLDVVAAIAKALHEEFKQPLYAAPPSLSRLVEAGHLGRKTGRGFHTY